MSNEWPECEHINTYQDQLQGHWHCDDCGHYFGRSKPEPQKRRDKEENARSAEDAVNT